MEHSHFTVSISENPALEANSVVSNRFRLILFLLALHLGIEVNHYIQLCRLVICTACVQMYCLCSYVTQLENLSEEKLLL